MFTEGCVGETKKEINGWRRPSAYRREHNNSGHTLAQKHTESLECFDFCTHSHTISTKECHWVFHDTAVKQLGSGVEIKDTSRSVLSTLVRVSSFYFSLAVALHSDCRLACATRVLHFLYLSSPLFPFLRFCFRPSALHTHTHTADEGFGKQCCQMDYFSSRLATRVRFSPHQRMPILCCPNQLRKINK